MTSHELDAIAVLTSKDRETIFQLGGTQSWVLNMSRAQNMRYAIIFAHGGSSQGRDKSDHGRALMLGEIAYIEHVENERRPQRWRIVFKRYADIDIPYEWPGFRNPITYMSLASLGIDVSTLDFKTMPASVVQHDQSAPEVVRVASRQNVLPLTIQQAKLGLAAHFGVTPDTIEITIRG